MTKKIMILTSVIVLLFSSLYTFPQNKAEAVVSKIATKAAKSAAIKSISFVIEKKAKETIKDMATKEVSEEISQDYVKKQTFLFVRNGADKKLYQVKEYSRMTELENERLVAAINKNIEARITGGRQWNLFENILDWFLDYKTIVGGAALITAQLSGQSLLDLEQIAWDSLLDAGLMFPAVKTGNTSDFINSTDGSSWNLGSSTSDLPNEGDGYWEYKSPVIQTGEFNEVDIVVETGGTLQGKIVVMDFLTDPTPSYPEGDSWDWNFDFGVHKNYRNWFFTALNILPDYVMMYPSGIPVESFTVAWNGTKLFSDTFDNIRPVMPGDMELQPVLDMFQNLKRVKWHYPDTNTKPLIIEFSDLTNTLTYYLNLTHLDFEMDLDTFEISGRGEATPYDFDVNLDIRVIDGTKLHGDTNPQPNKEDVEISKSPYEKEDQVSFPNITEIPLTNPATGTPVEVVPVTNPDTGEEDIIVIDPETGEPVPDDTPDPIAGTPVVEDPDPTAPPDPEPLPEKPIVPPDTGTGTPTPDPDDPTKKPDEEANRWKNLITTQFPFSLPWDIYAMLEVLMANPVRPEVDIDETFMGIDFKFKHDFAWMDDWAPFFRTFILISFSIFLILSTRRLMGGGQ